MVSLVISEGYTELGLPGNTGLADYRWSQIHNPLYFKYLMEIEFDWLVYIRRQAHRGLLQLTQNCFRGSGMSLWLLVTF